MTTAFLIPKPGLRVRDPKTLALLPADGAQVRMDSYWHRRRADGDVTAGKPPRPQSTTPTKPAKRAASRGAQE